MKAFALSIAALGLASAALANENKIAQSKADFKSYIVTFANDSLVRTMEDMMSTIAQHEGTITHVYQIITGFSALAPESIMQQLAKQDGVTVEPDQVVNIN